MTKQFFCGFCPPPPPPQKKRKLKLICGGHFELQWNLEKVTCTSPYRGECDCKIWIISDFKFWSFCAHKNNRVELWRPFWISVASLKIAINWWQDPSALCSVYQYQEKMRKNDPHYHHVNFFLNGCGSHFVFNGLITKVNQILRNT